MDAALCRSHTADARAGRASTTSFPPSTTCGGWCEIRWRTAIEHADGLKCTVLLMSGLVRDFNFAAYVNGSARSVVHADVPADARWPHHARRFLQPAGESTVEQMFLTGKAAYPVERDAAHHRADRGRRREPLSRARRAIDTPHLAIRYQPTKESTFWRT